MYNYVNSADVTSFSSRRSIIVVNRHQIISKIHSPGGRMNCTKPTSILVYAQRTFLMIRHFVQMVQVCDIFVHFEFICGNCSRIIT